MLPYGNIVIYPNPTTWQTQPQPTGTPIAQSQDMDDH